MEWAGFIVLMIIIFYCDYPAKVRKLEKNVKKLERNEKGDLLMSKIILGLVGEKCKIQMEEKFLGIGTESIVDVLDADDEWIKISLADKKGNTRVQILRIETIRNIELVSE